MTRHQVYLGRNEHHDNDTLSVVSDVEVVVVVDDSGDNNDDYDETDSYDNDYFQHNNKRRRKHKQRVVKAWYMSPIVVSLVVTMFAMFECSQTIFKIQDSATMQTKRTSTATRSNFIKGTLSSLWSDVLTAGGGSSRSMTTSNNTIENTNETIQIGGSSSDRDSSSSRSQQPHFVPTMTFQYLTSSSYSEDKYCDPPRELTWEWSWNSGITQEEYNNNTILPDSTTGSRVRDGKIKKKRVLIGMYVGYDQYAKLMYYTSYINKAYGKIWNYDVVILQGTALSICKRDDYDGRRVTLNKIRLLFHAIDHRHVYDQLLLLDSDAMIYNFTTDVSTLLPQDENYMVAGHYVEQKDFKQQQKQEETEEKEQQLPQQQQVVPPLQPKSTWDINAGTLLWNLHHPLTRRVAVEWYVNARDAVLKGNFKGDQIYLHRTLRKSEERIQNTIGLPNEFAYGHGTVIRHYIRRIESKNWKDPQILDDRLNRIINDADDICDTYSPACDNVERVTYPTE